MVAAAWGGTKEADLILLLVGSIEGLDSNTRAIVERLQAEDGRAILALNKVDGVKKPALLKLATQLDGAGVFTYTFMISAKTGSGVPHLLAHLTGAMPEGPWLYPEDQLTDMPGRLLAAEITREKIYLQLHQELPYAASVDTESWKEKKDGSVRIEVSVYVERPSQKAIVLGKGGARIKAIGEAARIELEELLDRRVHLFLFVKVRKDWGEDPERYRDLGLDYKA
jgi:GTP-binding protein Era